MLLNSLNGLYPVAELEIIGYSSTIQQRICQSAAGCQFWIGRTVE